jgi:hypothetical protein
MQGEQIISAHLCLITDVHSGVVVQKAIYCSTVSALSRQFNRDKWLARYPQLRASHSLPETSICAGNVSSVCNKGIEQLCYESYPFFRISRQTRGLLSAAPCEALAFSLVVKLPSGSRCIGIPENTLWDSDQITSRNGCTSGMP